MCDAALLLRGKGGTAAAIVEEFVQYEGTTAAAMNAARAGGFEKAVADALSAAREKARQAPT